jgi:hypothetical protein
MDNIDTDFALAKYSTLMNNDPRLIRSPQQLAQIRQQRAEAQQQEQQNAMADRAQKLAAGAENLSNVDVGGGKNALQQMIGA